jgi:alpha-1,6-mannosyltransferase
VKSLHLTNSWHANSGGIATFYRSLMQAAERRGHSMVLVIPGEKDEVEDVGACGRLYRVSSPPAPVNRDYRLIRPFSYFGRGTRLRQILRTEHPDLVEVCDKYTLNYFGGMLRAGMMDDVDCQPVVVGLSCERMDDNVRAYLGWNRLAPGLVRFYMKWLYFSLFDHHIANSHYTAEELRPASCGYRIPRGVWIRPMGVDCRGLSPSHRSPAFRRALCQRVSAAEDSALLLYVGRLVPEKNLRLLTETLSALHARPERDWRLIVVGDGIGRDEFLAESERRAPAHVAWLGHQRNRSELAQIYANCDVFVHPNPREPFGIAPLEAMASGLPLVAPDRGGVLSYANSSNAWIVHPTREAFAQAVREAIFDDHLRQCRIANALRTAEQFRWENVANTFLDLYEDMLRLKSGDQLPRFHPDFVSTPPDAGPSTVARLTSGILERLLANR